MLAVEASTAVLSGSRGSINGSSDSATVVIDGRSAAIDISLTVAPTTVHKAGEVVTFELAGTNTGNLRVSGLSLELSGAPIEPTSFSCNVAGQVYDMSALAALTQATIEPQQGGSCTGNYTVTTADLEAGVRSLTVTVTASSAMGAVVDTSHTVEFTPVITRALTADIALELCSNATASGRCKPNRQT